MTDEKEDIVSKIEQLIKDIKSGAIENEPLIAELEDIKYLIAKNLN